MHHRRADLLAAECSAQDVNPDLERFRRTHLADGDGRSHDLPAQGAQIPTPCDAARHTADKGALAVRHGRGCVARSSSRCSRRRPAILPCFRVAVLPHWQRRLRRRAARGHKSSGRLVGGKAERGLRRPSTRFRVVSNSVALQGCLDVRKRRATSASGRSGGNSRSSPRTRSRSWRGASSSAKSFCFARSNSLLPFAIRQKRC